jgi:hypothetical protein
MSRGNLVDMAVRNSIRRDPDGTPFIRCRNIDYNLAIVGPLSYWQRNEPAWVDVIRSEYRRIVNEVMHQ